MSTQIMNDNREWLISVPFLQVECVILRIVSNWIIIVNKISPCAVMDWKLGKIIKYSSQAQKTKVLPISTPFPQFLPEFNKQTTIRTGIDSSTRLWGQKF